jgi:6-pyruvoyltetrahydropterin/6-carboxytetrahydropterin synthase
MQEDFTNANAKNASRNEPARGEKAERAVELSRSVRFAVSLVDSSVSGMSRAEDGRDNSFAAWPSMQGLGAYYEMIVTVRGVPDRVTGYLMNITEIDRAVRQHALPVIESAVRTRQNASPSSLLRLCLHALEKLLGDHLHALRWRLTPYYSLAMSVASPQRVLMTQSFEFAAAHRLHCDELDDRANRETFGKCNWPSGHGHNYRLEVAVMIPIDERGDATFTLQTLERVVNQQVVQRFDHRHLNKDVPEFATVNPSVENIARECHRLLDEAIRKAGAELRHVTVWETEKTSCTYPAPAV